MVLIQNVKRYLILVQIYLAQSCSNNHLKRSQQAILSDAQVTLNGIPLSTRAHWMRIANQAPVDLISPCSFAPFGTAIVNHTSNASGLGLGDLVCLGANNNSGTGNPTLHGEVAAINSCTAILTDPRGRYRYSPAQALSAWRDLTLYTNAESCPMCASAIRWGGFKEYVYGTSIDRLVSLGWGQIAISSHEVFQQSWPLGTSTGYLGDVLVNETDPAFSWQFSHSYPCSGGCSRDGEGVCAPTSGSEA